MSVREYIGARYVPIIADPIQWDPTREYEPLTIVTNEGNSFTSRQYVPAGVSIDNAKYWASTGNFSSQIEQYRQEVLAFDGRISANESDIQALEGVIPASSFSSSSTVADAIAAISALLPASDFSSSNTVSNALGTLQDNVSVQLLNARQNFRDSYVIIIGDSWNAGVADGAISNYDIANGWGSQLADRLKMNRNKLLNYGQPSAGFVSEGGSQNRTFRSLLDLADAAMGDNRDKVAHIIVGGGINDASDIESGTSTSGDVQTAVTAFCNRCALRFPNAIVHIFPMLFPAHVAVRVHDVICKNSIINGARYANAAVDICEYAPEWLFGRAGYFGSGSQGRHTTIDGLVEVSRYMAAYLSGSYARFSYWTSSWDTTKTLALNPTSSETQIKDGIIRCHITGKVNSNYNGANVPFYALASGNTFFKSLHRFDFLASVSGFQAPAMFKTSDNLVALSSPGAATIKEGSDIFMDIVMPFAF